MATRQYMADRVTGITSAVFANGDTLNQRSNFVYVYKTQNGDTLKFLFEDCVRNDKLVPNGAKFIKRYPCKGAGNYKVIKPQPQRTKVRVFKSHLNKYQVLSDWTDAEICKELSDRSKFCGEMFERVNCKPHKKKKLIKLY